MDPNTSWKWLLNALTEGDVDGAQEVAEDLLSWLDAGGFQPTKDRSEILVAHIAQNRSCPSNPLYRLGKVLNLIPT